MECLEYINNQEPALQKAKFPGGDLYFSGSCNLGWPKVADILTQDRFPCEVRGNFAFIWQGSHGTVAAVDHLSSVPLFYSKFKISNLFHELLLATPGAERNVLFDYQLEFLGGHSFIDEETTHKKISRIMPNHYYKAGKQFRYFSPLEYEGDKKINREYFSGLVEEKILNLCRGQNTLLLSGGTDSTAIAAIIKKLGLSSRFEFIHVYSGTQSATETHIVQEIAAQMKLKVLPVQVDFSGDISPEDSGRQFSFWVDNPFLAKKLAIKKAGLSKSRIFTGEIGDQLFGGPKNPALLNYFLQSKPVSADEIAAIWINQSASYGRHCGTKPMPRLQSLFLEHPESKLVYEQLRTNIAETFMAMKTKDILNRFMLLNYIVKGPYRTWAYSQDTLDWVHPFADWEIFDYIFKLSAADKVSAGGVSKWILLDTWREFLSDIPWKVPKHGLGIPAVGKLRNQPRNMEY